MNQNYEKELHRAEREKEWSRRADSFWNAFQMTENGHVKSTLLLNSFCLMILLVLVYGAAFYLLADPIHAWFSGSPLLENLLSALLPAVVGTAVCGLLHFLCQPQTVLAAYLWLLVLSLACLVTMLILLRDDGGAIRLFLRLFALLIPAPLLCGIGSTLWVFRRRNAN